MRHNILLLTEASIAARHVTRNNFLNGGHVTDAINEHQVGAFKPADLLHPLLIALAAWGVCAAVLLWAAS
jgi:hypothetical protein